MSDEGTTFMQWKERAQSEVREEDGPRFRAILLTASIVVVAALVIGAVILLLA